MAPTVTSYEAHLEGLELLLPARRYRLARGLTGGRFISPEGKLQKYRNGFFSTREGMHRMSGREPVAVNSLPQHLRNGPPLIDFYHWAEVNEKLRDKGKGADMVVLQCLRFQVFTSHAITSPTLVLSLAPRTAHVVPGRLVEVKAYYLTA